MPQNVANAAADTVLIDSLVVSRCGDQQSYASGSATYADTTRHLIVQVDNTKIYDTFTMPAVWVTPLFPTTVGTHTIKATLYAAVSGSDETIVAQAEKTLVIPACSTPADPGDEKDCCPGPDPVVNETKATQNKGKTAKKVAGITQVKTTTSIVDVPITAPTGAGLLMPTLGSISLIVGLGIIQRLKV